MLDFRFYLINERTGGAKVEIEEPVGFDAFKPILRRDVRSHGVMFEFTEQRLGFYKKAYSIVKREYEEMGVEGDLLLLIEYTTNGSDWQEFYRGTLSFMQYEEVKETHNQINIGIAQLGNHMTVYNREDVKVDLDTLIGVDGAELPSYSGLGKIIDIPSKSIKMVNRTTLENYVAEQHTIHSAYYYIKIPFGEASSSQIPTFNSSSISTVISRPWEQPLFVNEESKECVSTNFEITGQGSITVSTYQDGSDPSHFFWASLYIQVYDTNNNVIHNIVVDEDTLHAKIRHDFTYDINEILPIQRGYKLTAVLRCRSVRADFTSNIYIIFSKSTKIAITTNSRCNESESNIYMLHEALSKVAESITNGNVKVKSDYYGRTDSQPYAAAADGHGSLRCITNGYQLRRAKMTDNTTPSVAVSWKELYEALKAIDNVGYGFIDNNTIRVEPWKWFYNDEIILRCTDIDKITRSVDHERCYNTLTVGYDKWEAEEQSGIDGFHGKRQYVLNLKKTKVNVEQICKFVADSYAIEATRRQQFSEEHSSKDWRYDNNIFILDLVRNGGSFNVNTSNGDRDTLVDPNTVFNVELSPARMAARWFSWVTQGIGSNTLRFAGAEGYSGAKTTSKKANSIMSEEVLEHQNLEACFIRESAPILKSEQIEFKYPLSIAGYNAIKVNPYGLIEFDGNFGYIKEIEYDVADGLAKFTLIPKREPL